MIVCRVITPAAILDTLAKYNIKATFFVVGDASGRKCTDIYQRIVNEGHTIAMAFI